MSKQATLRKRANRIVRERERLLRRRRSWTIGSAAVAVLLLVVLAVYAVSRIRQPEGGYPVPAAAGEDRVGLVIGTGPVTVELYSDFLCPACRAFERDARDDVDKLLADQKIRLVYRPVAILDRLSSNEYSTRSAAGAGCAADAGKLIDYAKLLFDNQPAEGGAGPTDEELIRLAGTAGITDPGFVQCVRAGRYVPWVGHVTATMEPNNVTGTPTVFVAGTLLQRPTGQRLVSAVGAAAAAG